FHDSTQPARVQQFVSELKQLHIPPRIAPDFNFKLGFPVFNFYAPFSYWLTGLINLTGFDIVSSLKLSFLLAILVGFFGGYLFLKNFFDFYPSLLGGVLYITSLYFPLDIFVRGNLAEVWFLALMPLTFHLVYKNSFKNNRKIFFLTTLILSFVLTSHNIYSLMFIPIILIFLLLLKNKKNNLLSFLFALFLSAYFWLPAIAEMNLTWAKEVAILTNFQNHFLCINQLWDFPWGYGGSTMGCADDGMSLKIGKIQLIFFGLGILLFLYETFVKKNKINKIYLFIIIYSLLFLFLALYQSKFIWELFSPIMSIVQFPWRFIGPSLLGISFFVSYFFQNLKVPFKSLFIFLIILAAIFINSKYFKGQEIKKIDFEKKYLSQKYIEKKAAYAIAEYLPKTIDYNYWRSLENKRQVPLEFIAKSSIEPFDKDRQTLIEKVGNAISIVTFLLLILFRDRIINRFLKKNLFERPSNNVKQNN
ncbi:MAG: 6-pyruvoyl-tetrahydropterin synthase-related protein, partial [Patescibacteria group bacterium]